jgi:hypothetical protein
VDVRAWLEGHGLGRYAEAFASIDVDGEVLRTLTADDLRELGVASLGHRKKLLAAIADLDAPGHRLKCSRRSPMIVLTPAGREAAARMRARDGA